MDDDDTPDESHDERRKGVDPQQGRGGVVRYGRNDASYVEKPLGGQRLGTQKLGPLIQQAKSEMQAKDSRNGVTYLMMGASGCGKSTLIKDVFIDQLYNGPLAEKEYIITMHTESPFADPYKGLSKKVAVDGYGLDEDFIHWCYLTNLEYDKRYNFVNILDDVIDIYHVGVLTKMFLIMRNTNLTSLVSLQYVKLIPVSIRSSAYFAFCMRSRHDCLETMVRSWMGGYLQGKKISDKMDEYDRLTQDHRFFFLDHLNDKAYYVYDDMSCFEMQRLTSKEQEAAQQQEQ